MTPDTLTLTGVHLQQLEQAVAGAAPESLPAALAQMLPQLRDLALEPLRGTPYSRRLLFASEALEVMLARWVPGERCAPHDHGGSSGYVALLEGDFAERRFDWHGAALVVTKEIALRSPASIAFGPQVIHDMAAEDGGLTLHAYCPAPGQMNVYDLDRQQVIDVRGNYGAWITPAADHPRTDFAVIAATR